MGKELPKGWVYPKLKEVVKYQKGKKPKILREEPFLNSEPYLDIKAFEKDEIRRYADVDSSHLIKENEIGIVWDGARSGWVGMNKRGAVGSTIAILRPMLLNEIYLYRFLQSKFDYINENTRGSGIPHVDPSVLWDIDFPLPPRAEQDRIVAKVDALMAKHAAIQQAMERIPQLLKDFRQQVLTQAVTGKLTEEWRVGKELEEWEETKERKKHREWDLNLPLKWKLLPFYSVANIDANLVDPNKYLDFVLVAPNNIEKATGQLLEKVLTREIKPKSDKHFFKAGSIVYSKIRPYLSKLILADFDGLCSADMYPISAEIDIHYLFQYMKSDEFLNFATTAGERSVLPKINQKGLNQIPVPVPPLEEQQEIFRRVESLFEKATAIEQRYEQLKSQIDTLPQAILHKAFKGELVPQLDSDGSAVELLEEIEEMKAKSKPKSKSKNKRSVRAAVENGLGMVAESGEAYNTTRIKK